jgi:hypothetical protein
MAWAIRVDPPWRRCAARPKPPGLSLARVFSRLLSGPIPFACGKNTYSRATQAGSGSGRRANRWRLQSSRSPRQRQESGQGRSVASPEGCPSSPRPAPRLPSAAPARPRTAHSSSPTAATGARSLGACIAVLSRGLSLCPALGNRRSLGLGTNFKQRVDCDPRSRPRAPLSSTLGKAPFTPSGETLSCPRSSRRASKKNGQLRRVAARAAPASWPAKQLFRLLPALVREVPARPSSEAGRGWRARAHWPARPQSPRGHVTITRLQPRLAHGRKWSWDCRKFRATFSSLSSQPSPLRPGNHLSNVVEGQKEVCKYQASSQSWRYLEKPQGLTLNELLSGNLLVLN